MKTALKGSIMLLLLAVFVAAQWKISLVFPDNPGNMIAWISVGWLALYVYLALGTGCIAFTWKNETRSDTGVLICGFIAIVVAAGSASALSFASWIVVSAWVAGTLAAAGSFWWTAQQVVDRHLSNRYG